MNAPTPVTINVVVAGLGGQGVIKASDILADAVFRSGMDVKKSELHGMSQRGGSVHSDVRFGQRVLSPMVTSGQADYMVVLAPDQIEPHRDLLKADGMLIEPSLIAGMQLPHPKSLNVALLGMLSSRLPIAEEHWTDALRANLPEKVLEVNLRAFQMGRALTPNA